MKIILIAALAYVMSLFLPFWSVAIAGFLGSLIIRTGWLGALTTGFLGIFLLWGITAILIDMNSGSILSSRIGELFSLSPPLLILVSAILGGITGGLGSLTGWFIREPLLR